MSNEGYIKLYRQLADNPLWKEKPFSRAQAWVDLLLKASYKEVKAVIKGQVVTLKRGQLLRAESTFAKEWGWSRGKVRRFIALLEREGMIAKNGTANGTVITIENYETFQDGRPQDGTTDGTTDGTGNKNIKNIKNKRGTNVPPARAEVSKYVEEMGYTMDADAFYDYYSETDWRKKNGQTIQDWKASVRSWERREKEFGKKDADTRPKPIEPPKYKLFEPEPEVEASQMPDAIRDKVKKLRAMS